MAEPTEFQAKPSPKSFRPVALLWVACALLAGQALPYFQHRWVEDESWYSMPAATLVRTGQLRNPAMPATDNESRVDTRPPLMPLSLAAAFRAFGFSVAAARLGEFLAALLTLLVVFAIGRELGDPLAGAIAGVLVAADNFLVLAARTARPEAWVTLCTSCALLLILRSRNTHSWKIAFTAGLAAGAACLFHVLGLAWLVGLGLLLVYQERWNIFRSPRPYAYAAGFALAILPFAIWLFHSPERITAAKYMYGRSAGATLAEVIVKEKARIIDFLGVSNQRLHLPFPLPLRLHIALAIAAAFAILLRRKPQICWTLGIVVATHLIWLLRLPNASARYYVILAPAFGLAMGFAVTALSGTRWHRAAMGVCALLIVTQLGGTVLVLNQARKADYPALTAKLRAAIPAGHSCYGAMTFQFALFDRECHSYDRTPFSYTAEVQRPEYLILGDRVMMHGSGRNADDFSEVRQNAFAFVERRGRLTARIDDPFYGDLRVYRITYDQPN
ncbi:MAG: glycosyltransferase family 39 protein [Acidobacteriia bacterium]|nr:glycosyltransferase family 39 protein [Terriglobia bacterium]